MSKVFSPKGKLLQSNPTKFCRFLSAILHRISNEIDEFTEFSAVNSHLLKFFHYVMTYVIICYQIILMTLD